MLLLPGGLGVGSHWLLLLLRQAHHQVPVAIDIVNPAQQQQHNQPSRSAHVAKGFTSCVLAAVPIHDVGMQLCGAAVLLKPGSTVELRLGGVLPRMNAEIEPHQNCCSCRHKEKA